MLNGYKSLREKERAERAIAEGRNPNALGRPAHVSKEEKATKRRAKEARYRANPEWKAKKYAAKNKARRLTYAAKAAAEGRALRTWRLTDEERKLARRMSVSKWQQKNKICVAANSRNRRARIKGNGGKHTAKDIRELFFEQNGLCGLCDLKLDANNFHVDHWKPLARGGSNDKSNLKLLHPHCNQIKATKDPVELRNKLIARSK